MILHNYAHPNAGGAYPYAETLWDRMLFIEDDHAVKWQLFQDHQTQQTD